MRFILPVLFVVAMLALSCNEPLDMEEQHYDTVYVPEKVLVNDTIKYPEGAGPFAFTDTIPG